MIGFHKSGYLMGAGSDPCLGKDAEGIVPQHAYSILDVKEIKNERLIKLRNPHGQHGVEWQGEWDDHDSRWTTEFKASLNYDIDSNDGIFWMSLYDFVEYFAHLYICRIFDEKWKHLDYINGEWKGKTAGGIPCKENPKADVSKNP